jgi:hypothetical protein
MLILSYPMSTPNKTEVTEKTYNPYVDLIARVIPGMLEVIGGGPAGPGGPLAALKAAAKAANPAQRAEIQRGAKSITKLAAAIQAAVR